MFAGASAGVAQKPTKACVFDTAAHTDTLTLTLSVRIFHRDKSKVDSALTREIGGLRRAALVAPPLAELFAPNSYFAPDASRRFSQVISARQIVVLPDGSLDFGPRKITNDFFARTFSEASFTEGLRSVAAAHAWSKPVPLVLQLVAITENIPVYHTPLLRVHVPLVRIETDSVGFAFPGRDRHTIHPSTGYDRLDIPFGTQFVVDQSGQLTTSGMDMLLTVNHRDTRRAYFSQAFAGGCPVAYSVPPGAMPKGLRP